MMTFTQYAAEVNRQAGQWPGDSPDNLIYELIERDKNLESIYDRFHGDHQSAMRCMRSIIDYMILRGFATIEEDVDGAKIMIGDEL